MKFIGAIAFLDSVKKQNDSRITNVMDFELAADWFTSVREFFTQMVLTGEYDGSEILITLYQYDGPKEKYAQVEAFDYDSDNAVDGIAIVNPYYAYVY